MHQFFSVSGRNQNLGVFPTCTVLIREMVAGQRVCVGPNHHLCSQWPPPGAVSSQCSDSGKTEPLHQAAPRNVRTLDTWSSSLLPSSGRSQELRDSFWWCGAIVEEKLWWDGGMHFPTGFDTADLMLDWGAGASQLTSGFFPKRIDPCIFVKLVCPSGEGSLGFSILLSCWYYP